MPNFSGVLNIKKLNNSKIYKFYQSKIMKLKNDFKFRNIIHKKEKLKIRNIKITLTSLHCIPKKFKKVYRNFYLKNTKIVRKYKSTFKKYDIVAYF